MKSHENASVRAFRPGQPCRPSPRCWPRVGRSSRRRAGSQPRSRPRSRSSATSAPWPTRERGSSNTVSPPARRAPPPSRVATIPPSSDPSPQSASSGPPTAVLPSAFAAAVTPTSVAPNTVPVPTRIRTSVRIAGDRSEPPRGLGTSMPGPPAPRRGLRGERDRPDEHHQAADHERAAGRPDRAEPECERRTEYECQLEHGCLEREQRRQGLGIADDYRQQRPDARLEWGCREPGRQASTTSTSGAVPGGSSPVAISAAP